MNPRIRLLALDLDGTLFGKDLHPSEPVRSAVRAAAAAGVRITLASGRIVAEEQRIISELGLTAAQTAPLIAYQGALVYQPGSGPLFSLTLPPEVAIGIIEYSRSLNIGVNLHSADATYVERPTQADEYYARLSQLRSTKVDDLVAFVLEHNTHPLKMVLVSDDQQDNDKLVAVLNQRWGGKIVAVRSNPRFCEATNPQANKGNALAHVAEKLNVPLAQVMAIGDDQNDITMLRIAGVGVAMGHAAAEVKAAARYVTGTLAEDGVATAIDRFILKGS